MTNPVIAPSEAGSADHFRETFIHNKELAALAAGILHRRMVPIGKMKQYLKDEIENRPVE